MGALPRTVNRSAGLSFDDDFGPGNCFDEQPSAWAKAPELPGGKHDVLAAPIGGNPDFAGLAVDSAARREVTPLDPPFQNPTDAAAECRGLQILSNETRRLLDDPLQPAFASCSVGWGRFPIGESPSNTNAPCLPVVVEYSSCHRKNLRTTFWEITDAKNIVYNLYR
jgi:hypothetical protein